MTLYKVRGSEKPEEFWGVETQSERLEAVLKFTPLGERVLDLGAGRGAYTEALNQKGFPTIGVDSYEYSEWTNHPEGWFIQSSADDLPFNNKTFHTTICFEVLEHCSHPEKVLKEIARCTSERLIISVPNCDLNNTLRQYDLALAHWTDPSHCNFFTKESIQNLLKNENYNILEISDCYKIDPNNYFWDSIKLPKLVKKLGKKICYRFQLTEIYYSSILIASQVPKQ